VACQKQRIYAKIITMKKLMEKQELQPFLKTPLPGEIVQGKIIIKDRTNLFLEISNFGTGVVRGKEFFLAKDILRDLKIGDEIPTKVITINSKDGLVEVSIAEAKQETTWFELQKNKTENKSFLVKALKANKGGLMVKLKGIPGFIPVSQLSAKNYPKVAQGDRAEILRKLQQLIGQDLEVRIIALDSKQKSLILSEKALTLKHKSKILENYKQGDIVEGEITGITDFGAFMKFPCSAKATKDKPLPLEPEESLEGLIHISELDWQLIQNPTEVVEIGEKVKAKIIEISNGRISLSLKALKQDPWKNIEEKYKKGDVVQGEVIKFNPFGAFIKIESDIQGLCHISEFKSQNHMKETLEIGKKYKFQISLISPEEHKMILTYEEK